MKLRNYILLCVASIAALLMFQQFPPGTTCAWIGKCGALVFIFIGAMIMLSAFRNFRG